MDYKMVTKKIVEMEDEALLKLINDFIYTDPSKQDVLTFIDACQKGLEEVGELYHRGKYFVGDLIFASELLTESVEILMSSVKPASYFKSGTILLGTVQGDLHDIGKNIFRSMIKAEGFEVFDLGKDRTIESFVNKVKYIKPDVIAIGGVLTASLEILKKIIDALSDEGVRDTIKVIIIGGYPVTNEACEYVGADAYAQSAVEGVKLVKTWIVDVVKGMRIEDYPKYVV